EALAIADTAHDAGLTCMVGAMMEPRISVTAAAHVALAHPAITLIDLESPDWFTTHLPSGGFAIERGRRRRCGGPGLRISSHLHHQNRPRHPRLDHHESARRRIRDRERPAAPVRRAGPRTRAPRRRGRPALTTAPNAATRETEDR